MALALLVDRDADTRQMYAEFLRQSAFEIEEATDGREALAKAISYRPAVVVTETRLPGMSGLELCRVLRTDPASRASPDRCEARGTAPGRSSPVDARDADHRRHGRQRADQRTARRSRRRRRDPDQAVSSPGSGG